MTALRTYGVRVRILLLVSLLCLCACGTSSTQDQSEHDGAGQDAPRYIVSVIDEPKTTDFQCTTIDYTIALNCFNRLVEIQSTPDGDVAVRPSLASSWEESDDGLLYTFHLRDDVTFSNGSPLSAQDVYYTFVRLLTHPGSCNKDIVRDIVGARELEAHTTDELSGLNVLDDYTFTIRLEQPYSAFLACLCMPSASILDQESTEEAGELFGVNPSATIGTGPFVFAEWNTGQNLLLTTNPTYWERTPAIDGVDLKFVYDPDTLSNMFKDGELDIINVDDMGDLGDYFLHGSAYKDRIKTAPHIGIDYIALNESVKPLDDVRVRKALQLALNRQTLLDAAYSGYGKVEHGIFPRGLHGYNPELSAIPYDVNQAKALLAEAGYQDGFDLEISMRATTLRWQRQLVDMVVSMWDKIGVRATVRIRNEEDFMAHRSAGKIACYTASWAADFDDPDNFIYTFFGSRENSVFRSLCYANDEAMSRIRQARAILDDTKRMQEYSELERIVAQDDAAWIPLFSRNRNFLVSQRVRGFTTAWNGWFEAMYKYMSVQS